MLYLVTEYASNGEMFGKFSLLFFSLADTRQVVIPPNWLKPSHNITTMRGTCRLHCYDIYNLYSLIDQSLFCFYLKWFFDVTLI